jgi:Zn-dependent oligopeptidase
MRDIAKQLGVKENQVRETVQRLLMPITPQLKLSAVQEALERFDLYQASQHDAAVKGDREAIAMCLKIEEQRAELLGTRAPTTLRLDPVRLVEQAQPQQTTTDRILEALDRIAKEPRSEEVTRVIGKSANGNGSPSSDEPDIS